MANIQIRDLTSIAGVCLLDNSGSFIQELSNDELNLHGGLLIDKLPPLDPYEIPEPWLPTPTH
jgi:hypothetical protein